MNIAADRQRCIDAEHGRFIVQNSGAWRREKAEALSICADGQK